MKELDLTKKYVLAVSGGIDSMAMLHMFSSLSPRPNFCVVTVNHNIRKEAQSDCDFVADYCKRLNVECRTLYVDVPKYAAERKLSEETAARILRYEALNKVECDYICLAHNTGDNAETVLMHILRGSGAQGATGIRRQNGKYLRPLLNMTREQIERYAKENHVPYVHDSTNDDTKYSRNFIRQNVLIPLKKLNPNAEKNIARFAANIAEDCDYLDSLVDMSEVEFGAGYARLPVRLLNLPKPIAYRTVMRAFNRLGVEKDVEKAHIEAIIDLSGGVGGRRVNLPFGFVAVADYDFVTLERAVSEHIADFEIPFTIGKTVTSAGVINVSKMPLKNALKFDLNSLPKNAVFRLKRQGDVFEKFGGGTKPLKKYLIDKKIPQRLRSSLILIASGNEVYAICGVEISDQIRVTDSAEVCYVEITKEEC